MNGATPPTTNHPFGCLTTAGKVVLVFTLGVGLFAFALLVAVWAGDMSALVVYFGFIFTMECLAMIVAVPDKPGDHDRDGTCSCFRKSWRFQFNVIVQLTTVMFLAFVITCVILLNIKPTGVTDDDKIIPVAVTVGVIISGGTIAFSGTRRATYFLSFWLLFAMLAFLEIPFPSWLNVFGGLLAVFFVTYALEKLFSAISRLEELHEHLAVGMGLIFSAYSLFDDWRYWYSRPYREYAPLFAMSGGAGVARMIWRYALKKLSPPEKGDIAFTFGSIDGDSDVSDDDPFYDQEEDPLVHQPIGSLRGHMTSTRPRT